MSLNTLLNIEIPIIQAPMAGVQNWALAVAVSDSGALGSIPCGMLSPEQVVSEIIAFRKQSSRPFNLNFFCHEMPIIDAQSLESWGENLRPYYQEFDLVLGASGAATRMPFSHEIADLIEPFAPEVISFHFGLPEPSLLSRVKGWGAKVLSSATTVAEGIWLEENGVDAVIAQGSEAGGHRGMFLTEDLASQVGTFALVSQLSDRLSVPIIAAGGIASAKDVNAAMMLGAAAVQVGTSFLLCPEANTSTLHKKALEDTNTTTAITNVFSGRPARGIRNRVMSDFDDMTPLAPPFPFATPALAPLRQFAEARGLNDFTPLWAGQNRSGCKPIPASQLIAELASSSNRRS